MEITVAQMQKTVFMHRESIVRKVLLGLVEHEN